LAEAIQGGHRVLLFSQFTTMLAIIRRHLDRKHVNYLYLDGSTKAQERDRLVRGFNQGEGDVFLISLKAGGTGLNLTGADVVIHYDPWWNPAGGRSGDGPGIPNRAKELCSGNKIDYKRHN